MALYTSECSKRPSSKAAASEGARRTFRYVEPLSDARTPLEDFFSILLVPIIQLLSVSRSYEYERQRPSQRIRRSGVRAATFPIVHCHWF